MYKDLKLLLEIRNIIEGLSGALFLHEKRFFCELIFGVLCSQSSQLANIVRACAPYKKVKAVYKRLDKNLGLYDLRWPYKKAQQKMLDKVDESYLLIFDPSEITKPFAKKMEGLAFVRDASEKSKLIKDFKTGKLKEVPVLKPGYPLRVAIAMAPNGDIVPVELSLYSTASENFISANDEYIQVLDGLIHKTNFLPTLVLDREFDSFIIIRHLCELRQKFIVRVTQNRKYRLSNSVGSAQTFNRENIIKKHAFLSSSSEITYTRKGETKTEFFEFKAAHVKLLSEQKRTELIRDVGDNEALTLVEVKIKKSDGTPIIYLLTNTYPKAPEDLEKVSKSYLARWNVEEYIRFLKQHFSLEEFLVRDLGRMKNLVSAVFISTVVMHLLTDRKTNKGFKNHFHLLKRSLPVVKAKKSRNFYLYSYGMGIANIVNMNKKLFLPPSHPPRKQPKNNAQTNL